MCINFKKSFSKQGTSINIATMLRYLHTVNRFSKNNVQNPRNSLWIWTGVRLHDESQRLWVCVSIALSSNLISLSRWVVMTRTNDIPRHATANEKCTRGHIRWPQMLSSFHLEIKFGIHQIDAHRIYLRCCRFERWTERTNSVAQYNKSTTFVFFSTRVWLEDGGPGQAITNNTGIPNEMIKHHLSCNVRRQPAAGRRWLPSKWALVLECPSSRPRIARWKSKNQITAFDLLISRKRIAHHSFDPASEQTPASQPTVEAIKHEPKKPLNS